MNENAYESPTTVDAPRKTRGLRWAIWSGIACLIVSVVCGALTAPGLVSSFQTIAQESETPKAQDLADGISWALIPSYGVVPLGIIFILLLFLGLVARRPIEETASNPAELP